MWGDSEQTSQGYNLRGTTLEPLIENEKKTPGMSNSGQLLGCFSVRVLRHTIVVCHGKCESVGDYLATTCYGSCGLVSWWPYIADRMADFGMPASSRIQHAV